MPPPSYQTAAADEQSSGRSEDMRWPGASRPSTSPAPVAEMPEPTSAADAAQVHSVETGRNAAANPPGDDAARPSSTASVSATASSSTLVAATSPSTQRAQGEVESNALVTDGGAAFGAELDVLMSVLAVPPSSEDATPPPSGDTSATGAAMDKEAAPKAEEKLEIISDDEAPIPFVDEDEAPAPAPATTTTASPTAEGRPEIISDDQGPIPSIVEDEAPSPAPARTNAPPTSEGRPEIISDDQAPIPAVQTLSDAEYKSMAEKAAGIEYIDEESPAPALTIVDGVAPVASRPTPSPPVPQGGGGPDQNLDAPMSSRPQPPPPGPRNGEGLDQALAIDQLMARSAPLPIPVPSNDAPDAQSQSTPALEATLVQGVEATLIPIDEREVVVAEPVSYFERKWKRVASGLVIFLVILVLLLSLLLRDGANDAPKEYGIVMSPTDVPSIQPSSPPSLDSRPTFEIVHSRGHIRCGMRPHVVESGEGLHADLCRAVAAVLFGSPDNIVGVPLSIATRFQQLRDKTIDVLIGGDTRTVEREVRERSTGVGFTFSSTYYYDGMAYLGNETLVRCAEERGRFDECASLSICTRPGSSAYDFVQTSFPSDFLQAGSSVDELTDMLLNDTCNVIASDHSLLMYIASNVDAPDRNFIVGEKLKTKEPLGIVTRKDDVEFSDIVNWVVQSLFYGEEQGLTKNPAKCRNYTSLTADVMDLTFTNAFYCVGNYAQILGAQYQKNRGMNQINNGTTGMLYAIPFGDLEPSSGALGGTGVGDDGALLGRIRNEGSLNCGVAVPVGFYGELLTSNELVGMSVAYCHTVAAALFNGNHEAVTILTFPEQENSSFVALDDGTIDVLAGVRVERKYDFRSPSSLIRGFHFSIPYFYGNETATDDVSFHSLATREADFLFSSFVNCVVSATIFVEEEIKKSESIEIPMASIFGSEFSWALKDAVAYSGSYDQIYKKNFVSAAEGERGRNSVNNDSTPQIHSFPGIRQKEDW